MVALQKAVKDLLKRMGLKSMTPVNGIILVTLRTDEKGEPRANVFSDILSDVAAQSVLEDVAAGMKTQRTVN